MANTRIRPSLESLLQALIISTFPFSKRFRFHANVHPDATGFVLHHHLLAFGLSTIVIFLMCYSREK